MKIRLETLNLLMLDIYLDLELDTNQLYTLLSILLSQKNIFDVEAIVGFGPEACADKPYMIALVAIIGSYVKTNNFLVKQLYQLMPLGKNRGTGIIE